MNEGNSYTLPSTPITAHFKRTFKDGSLKGMTLDEKLHFASPLAAKTWAKNILYNSDRGALDCTVSGIRFDPPIETAVCNDRLLATS